MANLNQKNETAKLPPMEERIKKAEDRKEQLESELKAIQDKIKDGKNKVDNLQAKFEAKYPGFYAQCYSLSIQRGI